MNLSSLLVKMGVIIGYNSRIAEMLDQLVLGKPLTCQHVTVAPVYGIASSVQPRLISEVITNPNFQVKETGYANSLLIVNRLEFPVFGIEGMIFNGKSQNRALAESLVINAQDEIEVPVFCVEQGKTRLQRDSVYAGCNSIVMASARTLQKYQQETINSLVETALAKVDSPTKDYLAFVRANQNKIHSLATRVFTNTPTDTEVGYVACIRHQDRYLPELSDSSYFAVLIPGHWQKEGVRRMFMHSLAATGVAVDINPKGDTFNGIPGANRDDLCEFLSTSSLGEWGVGSFVKTPNIDETIDLNTERFCLSAGGIYGTSFVYNNHILEVSLHKPHKAEVFGSVGIGLTRISI